VWQRHGPDTAYINSSQRLPSKQLPNVIKVICPNAKQRQGYLPESAARAPQRGVRNLRSVPHRLPSDVSPKPYVEHTKPQDLRWACDSPCSMSKQDVNAPVNGKLNARQSGVIARTGPESADRCRSWKVDVLRRGVRRWKVRHVELETRVIAACCYK
jgi:hypothetical protein